MIFKTKQSKESSKVFTANKDFDAMDVTPEQIAEAAAKTWVIDMQAQIRRLMNEGKSDDEITTFIADWNPAYRAPRTAKPVTAENILDVFAKLPAEEQAKVLAGMSK